MGFTARQNRVYCPSAGPALLPEGTAEDSDLRMEGPMTPQERGPSPDLEGRRDDSLLPFLHEGTRPAVAELERRYGDALRRRGAQLLGDAALAEDVVQEVMLLCCQGPEAKLPEQELRAWLYRVTKNRCMDELRKRKVRAAQRIDDGAPSKPGVMPPDPLTSPSGKVWKRERATALRELIGRFPPELREVLMLRYFENRSRDQIGRELGLSQAVVKSRLVKAVAMLRQQLQKLREDSLG